MAPGIGASVGPWVVDQVVSFAEPSLVLAHRADDPSVRATVEVRRGSEAGRERHGRAVGVMGSLHHAHLPRLLDQGSGDTPWIAFQPFVGDTLSDRLEAGGVELHLACSWLLRIATVVERAHAAGWMLRGLSPHRVVVGAGPRDVWVLGLESAERPERPDPRDDVLAWGVLAHGMLTGDALAPAALRPDAPDEDVPHALPDEALDPGDPHPDWLRRLVRKCTDPDPARRLPDIEAAVACLEAARPSWDRPEPRRPTPFHIPRSELPPLDVRPTYVDANQLAEAMALAANQPGRLDRSLLVLMASAMGIAAGLAASVLVVLFVELSRLA